ncbi:hypothetical protein [Parenemella sanctibonifatiensis]|uniref:Serine protease n=1 Tax=Parenemella sanctibonifatiensis TaxID=2016505 RepID=A0A255EFQ2_9ACTN|nr:hypothetical protein [Parenemella sanctibonifatiensis]OYN90359.1 hypothetical protein CGZ91_09380 [Parenemella sanctibonifatiensis]
MKHRPRRILATLTAVVLTTSLAPGLLGTATAQTPPPADPTPSPPAQMTPRTPPQPTPAPSPTAPQRSAAPQPDDVEPQHPSLHDALRTTDTTPDDFIDAGEASGHQAQAIDAATDHDGYRAVVLREGEPVVLVNDPSQINTDIPTEATDLPALEPLLRAYLDQVGDQGLQGFATTADTITIRVSNPDQLRPGHDLTPADFAAEHRLTLTDPTDRGIRHADATPGRALRLAGVNTTPRWCTTAFSITAPQGDGVLTAGHCTNDGLNPDAEITQQPHTPTQPLGRVTWNQFGGPGNTPTDFIDLTGTDLALITDLDPNTTTPGLVPGDGATDIHIQGATPAPIGATACTRGAASGWSCGTVISTGSYFLPAPTNPGQYRAVEGFEVTGLTLTDGDSGAPVVIGNYAAGILSAGDHTSAIIVPINALTDHGPGGTLTTWVPSPTINDAQDAGPGHVLTTPDQPIHGHITPTPGLTLTASHNHTPIPVTGPDTNGAFTITPPANTTGPITITATDTTGSRSLPLTIHPSPRINNTAIHTHWLNQGGAAGWMGPPTTTTQCGLPANGCQQAFTHHQAHITTSNHGTHHIRDDIATRWTQAGGATGPLGYPTTDPVCGLTNGGCYQHFSTERTIMYWSPTTGAHWTRGYILDKYATTGYETGQLGYPTTSETCGLTDGGCLTTFEHGTITWTPNNGINAYYTLTGPINDLWANTNAERGTLGYPTTDPGCLNTTHCQQTFEHGAIYNSPSGTYPVHGRNWDKYRLVGGELGYPTMAENCTITAGGCYQHFETGGSLYYNPHAATSYLIRGLIKQRWADLGWENSWLSYPTTDETCYTDGRCQQDFHGDGTLYWTPGAPHPYYMRGTIRTKYRSNPTWTNVLGYPTSDEICGLPNNGCKQNFLTTPGTPHPRTIHWTASTGAHPIIATGILQQYHAANAENGRYGYPTQDQHTTGTTHTQQFQGGTLTTTTP